jgi:hypothetical protein
MGLASDLIVWLESQSVGNDDFPPPHYQHLPEQTPDRFCWFMVSDSLVTGDSLDGEPPDTFVVDLEIYTDSTLELEAISAVIAAMNDYSGDLGSGSVQLVEIGNQSDDYVPLVDRDDLPAYFSGYRLTLIGYEPT